MIQTLTEAGITYEVSHEGEDILLTSETQDVRIVGAYEDLKQQIRREYAHFFVESDDSISMDYNSERVEQTIDEEIVGYATSRFSDGEVIVHETENVLAAVPTQNPKVPVDFTAGYLSALANLQQVLINHGLPVEQRLDIYFDVFNMKEAKPLSAQQREEAISTIITKSIKFSYVSPEDYKALHDAYAKKTDAELSSMLTNVQRIPVTA